MRKAWCSFLRARAPSVPEWPELLHPDGTGHDDAWRVLLLGDPGEGDVSQWAMKRPLRAVASVATSSPVPGGQLAFLVVVSDVVYPAGEAAFYQDRFHGPLDVDEISVPVYAIPGNHDWDDGSLQSFVLEFCNVEPFTDRTAADPADWVRNRPHTLSEALKWPVRLKYWRDAHAGREGHEALEQLWILHNRRLSRLAPGYPSHQPAPYWCADVHGVRIIGIDTGFGGEELDSDQMTWLREQLNVAGPKILVTGKPLVSESEFRRTALHALWDELTRTGVLAVIGGDVHNYQRYTPATTALPRAKSVPEALPVPPTVRDFSADAFRPEVIVAGGSGAFMSGTVHGSNSERVAKLLTEYGLAPVTMYPSPSQSRAYAAAGAARLLSDPVTKFGLAFVGSILLLGSLAAVCLVVALVFPKSPWYSAIVFAPLVAVLAYLAIFLPLGTLASALPLPTTGSRSIVTGALAVGLLLIAFNPIVASEVGTENQARFALVLGPLLIAMLSYARRMFSSWGRKAWLIVLLALGVAAALWYPWVHAGLAVALAALCVSALAFFGVRWVVRGTRRPQVSIDKQIPWIAATLALASALAVGFYVNGRIDPTQQAWSNGRVFVFSTLVVAVAGAIVFVVLSLLGTRPGLVGALVVRNKDATVWASMEAIDPPFYKSFLEIIVSPRRDADSQSVDIVTYGVSGFESDADAPFVIDHVKFNISRG